MLGDSSCRLDETPRNIDKKTIKKESKEKGETRKREYKYTSNQKTNQEQCVYAR